jgi:hypothetical protein
MHVDVASSCCSTPEVDKKDEYGISLMATSIETLINIYALSLLLSFRSVVVAAFLIYNVLSIEAAVRALHASAAVALQIISGARAHAGGATHDIFAHKLNYFAPHDLYLINIDTRKYF